MSLFDSNQKSLITSVQTLYGEIVDWLPSNGGELQTAKVLYNYPEAKQTLGDADKYEYSPYNYWFDYFETQFPGLKASVDAGNVETVTVKEKVLCVRAVDLKFDGKTLLAFCDEYREFKNPLILVISAKVVEVGDAYFISVIFTGPLTLDENASLALLIGDTQLPIPESSITDFYMSDDNPNELIIETLLDKNTAKNEVLTLTMSNALLDSDNVFLPAITQTVENYVE